MRVADSLIEAIRVLSTPSSDPSSVMVSKRSRIYDLEWDFRDDLEHRPRTVGDTKLRVDWNSYQFSNELRKELQRVFGLYAKAPKMFTARGAVKPNTLCMKIHRSLDFLDAVVDSFPSRSLITSLDQFETLDFAKVARTYPGSSHDNIRQGLSILFSPQATKLCGGSSLVTPQDVKKLEFKKRPLTADEQGEIYFPDALFALLSESSTARVSLFLARLGGAVEDRIPPSVAYEVPEEIRQISDFGQALEKYSQWRRVQKGVPISKDTSSQLRTNLKKMGVRLGAMFNYLNDVNSAAQCVIALYVALRFSELASIQVDCLEERDGISTIVGRVFKNKSDNNISDDSWVAIAAVRDAIKVLEMLAPIKNNRYLFSSLETCSGKGSKGTPLSFTATGYVNNLGVYLRKIDVNSLFDDWKFNSHQFKHSLTRQLVKAKLGLPYISFHLKHLHSRVASLPNDVTLAYGNAAKLLQSQMAGYHLEEVRRERARKIFDPESVVYGGGAKEFDERRKSYFRGLMGAGMSKEQIINDLASTDQAMFVNVGLGYCTGRRKNPLTGDQPPCIGSLRCNPNKCANAIVTEVHEPGWRAVLAENERMLSDSRFAYGRAEFQEAIGEAKGVLAQLGWEDSSGPKKSV